MQKFDLYKELKSILEDHEQDQLLNSSIDKDIVVFIGNTGAGKTTLLNQLYGKEMEITRFGQLQLKNPDDPTAMRIGKGQKSQTSLPQQAQIGSLSYYDLPGIGNNRGLAINLVNGSFIKNIIEKARTVRLVFVAGQDEMTAKRGESFMEILRIAKVLIPNNRAIESSSILVVTKSFEDTSQGLIEFVEDAIGDNQILNVWLTPNRMFPMSRQIIAQQKEDIMENIIRMNAQKIDKVEIEAIYNINVRNSLRELFRYEMSNSIDKIFNKQPLDEQNFDLVKSQKAYFQEIFYQDVTQDLERSTMIQILQPLSEKIFRVEFSIFLINVNEKKQMRISQLDSKIKDEDIRLQDIKLQKQFERTRQETQLYQKEYTKNLEIIEQQNAVINADQIEVKKQLEETEEKMQLQSTVNIANQIEIKKQIEDNEEKMQLSSTVMTVMQIQAMQKFQNDIIANQIKDKECSLF